MLGLCFVLQYFAPFKFAIILLSKREVVALLLLFSEYHVTDIVH